MERYRRNRVRTRALFGLLSDEAYYSQPIALRHPIVFYEGHLPAFSFTTLVTRALGGPRIDPVLEDLFARGIDPAESTAGAPASASGWPSREAVRAFTGEADRLVEEALSSADIDRPGHPFLDRAEAVFTILEHEEMHQETLLYLWHRLPIVQKRRPLDARPGTEGLADMAAVPRAAWVEIPEGTATLGVDRESMPFGWDNEHPACSAEVSRFAIERHDVTNERFLEFVEAGGYRDSRWWTPEDWHWIQTARHEHPAFWEREGHGWCWRGMFGLMRLPPAWPVYVSFAEASAFATWRGARLPTEAEFQRAAYGPSVSVRRL